jgi:hypothetical protein
MMEIVLAMDFCVCFVESTSPFDAAVGAVTVASVESD